MTQQPVDDPVNEFADAPKSFLEEKAERVKKLGGKIWTPRDVLINMLRDIDNGMIKPDSLVIAYRVSKEPGYTRVSWLRSAPDHETSIGILAEAILQMHRTCVGE